MMKMDIEGFLGIPGEWNPDADDIAASARLGLSAEIWKRMHDLELDEEGLADRAGIPVCELSAIIQGDRDASVTTISKIAEALETRGFTIAFK